MCARAHISKLFDRSRKETSRNRWLVTCPVNLSLNEVRSRRQERPSSVKQSWQDGRRRSCLSWAHQEGTGEERTFLLLRGAQPERRRPGAETRGRDGQSAHRQDAGRHWSRRASPASTGSSLRGHTSWEAAAVSPLSTWAPVSLSRPPGTPGGAHNLPPLRPPK